MSFKLLIFAVIYFATYSFGDEDEPINRIINGFTPGRNDNPHVVLLFIRFADRRAACTGALISPTWVLTAGHCAKDAESIDVNLGVFNRTEPIPQTITVNSNNIFVHPSFVTNATVTINDVALLRLNPRANTSLRSIQTIPYVCSQFTTYARRTGRVCGWGITNDNATNITTVLQCVDQQVITNTECQNRWGNQVRSTNLCTSVVDSRTTCGGDSGAPLLVRSGLFQAAKVVGTVSFGSVPCNSTDPDVFSRITSFSRWIQSTSKVPCSVI